MITQEHLERIMRARFGTQPYERMRMSPEQYASFVASMNEGRRQYMALLESRSKAAAQ